MGCMHLCQIPTYDELYCPGRAMELGRECLEIWGYKRVDELIWVKTNQLQRLIRTGRTGHWLNHSKEHCLVGVKGEPNINRCIDCDVLVAEVRVSVLLEPPQQSSERPCAWGFTAEAGHAKNKMCPGAWLV